MAVTLGQLIRERRMELNLTQEELAERVGEGVRQSEISRLERNRVTLPRRHRMEEIALALEIPVGVLLARSGWAGAEAIDAGLANLDVAESEPAGQHDVDLASTNDADWREDEFPHDPAGRLPSNGTGTSTDEASSPAHAAMLQAEDSFLAGEHGDESETNDAWTAEDSQALRETVARTESLIEQSRTRLRDAESTMVRGRRSVEWDTDTGPH